MSAEVTVQYAVAAVRGLPSTAVLRQWARLALAARRPAELTLRLVDEAEMAELNQAYRGKAGTTNVLSFPTELPVEVADPYLGDVVICAPVIAAEAAAQGKAAQAHWAHMVIHGVLHLLGYDHQRAADAAVMEAQERDLLARLGYPNPYEDYEPAINAEDNG